MRGSHKLGIIHHRTAFTSSVWTDIQTKKKTEDTKRNGDKLNTGRETLGDNFVRVYFVFPTSAGRSVGMLASRQRARQNIAPSTRSVWLRFCC